MIQKEIVMTDRCYKVMLDLLEISGFIHDYQFDSWQMLLSLLRTESRLMMILAIELKNDIDARNKRFLTDYF